MYEGIFVDLQIDQCSKCNDMYIYMYVVMHQTIYIDMCIDQSI